MRYPGGKNLPGIFQRLINLMPPHRVYIEAFLGSGAIMRLKKQAPVSIGIDRLAPNPALLQPGRQIIQANALEWLPAYPWQGDEMVYLDPPYLAGTRTKKKIYEFEMTDSDHRRLLGIIKRIPAKVLISGYPSKMYDEALAGWHRVEYRVFTRAHTWKTEVAWMNYAPPAVLHDPQYTGQNFRERWRNEKRRRNLVGKFLRLPPLERAALFSALVDVMG